jgi:hypothetical protein
MLRKYNLFVHAVPGSGESRRCHQCWPVALRTFGQSTLTRPAKRMVRFYNQPGTAEQWINEGKNAVKWARLSCHDFVDNQVRLQLFVLAYNLGNFLRQAVLPQAVRHRTLTTLRENLIKIGAKVVRHSRKIVFHMAEVAVPRELFQAILEGIMRLRVPAAASG